MIRPTKKSSLLGERPRLDLQRSRFEVALEVLAVLGVLMVATIFITQWGSLPDRVPVHFSLDGIPDSWGSKDTLIAFPMVMLVLFAALTAIARVPHIFNYPWSITAENAPVQYRLARTLITFLKTAIVWLAVYITWEQVQTASGRQRGISFWFLPVALTVIFGAIAVYLLVASRRK